MNVRFSDRHIRFRVARQEVERLLAGRSLTLDVPMPRAHQFRASINITSTGDWQLDSDPTGLWLTLPRKALEGLLQELPSKEGLEHEFATNGQTLAVALEVDLRSEREKKAA
jgi:hypothetical protein